MSKINYRFKDPKGKDPKGPRRGIVKINGSCECCGLSEIVVLDTVTSWCLICWDWDQKVPDKILMKAYLALAEYHKELSLEFQKKAQKYGQKRYKPKKDYFNPLKNP